MAEYYPLISRAVAGLREGAPEARRSIYDRARAALVGQLRGMQPPVPDEAVNRELAALDEAIARIEGELTPGPTAAEAGPAAVEAALQSIAPNPSGTAMADAPRPAAAEARVPAAAPAAPAAPSGTPGSASADAAPSKPPQTSRPAAPLVARRSDPPPARSNRPVFEPRPSLPPGRPEGPRAGVARPAAPAVPDRKPAEPPAPAEPAVEAGAPPAQPSPPLPPAPSLAAERLPSEPTLEASRDWPDAAPEIVAERAGGVGPERREEGIRPAVRPQRREAKPGNLRVWIVAAAALAAVVVIALTAWKLRDNPEELAKSAPSAGQQADNTPGKIAERADGSAPSDDGGAATDTPPAATAAPTGAGPSQATPPAAASVAGSAPQPAGDQAIPVSYKAAILVAAPETPERVKTYVGSVVWRSESVGQGQEQPLGTAVRADVDVPEAKLQLVMEIRKNTEAQFPASHTIDLKFTVAPDSPIGPVKQVDVPQMRREDAATGDPLVGVPVTITSNYFLVGLTRGDAEARNVEAIKSRGWFDIPMVLESGKPAKITFEKGASGDRIIADALAAWNRP